MKIPRPQQVWQLPTVDPYDDRGIYGIVDTGANYNAMGPDWLPNAEQKILFRHADWPGRTQEGTVPRH